MGSCCSHDVSVRGKVESEVDDVSYEYDHENDVSYEQDGAMIRLRGSSRFVSMYTQQGKKGVNQDAMAVWEDFTGEKDTILCGVFDGHGPLGHKVSQFIRDNLPSKLSAAIKMSQQKACKYYDANDADTDDAYDENYNNMSLASWEACFLKTFDEMDDHLAQEINTDSYCSGCTAVTLIKQGDQLIVGNLGDSRAVLCTREGNQLIPVQLTVDLKPDIPSEASRIINCEGRVFAAEEEPDVYRLWMPDEDCPGLAMSRAFGDFCLKDYGLISAPDVFYRKLSNQDEFVVLATDGVWDVLTNNEVINIVASAPRRSMAAKLLVKRAVKAWKYKYPGSKIDDCAVICLFLDDQPVLSHSQSSMSRRNRHHSKRLHISKSTRNEDTETVDGKVGVDLNEEWTALGGLARANSISKLPRLARNMSRRQSSKYLKGS
ncbi:probable protein phosphatase 2C 65 [Gastrolobium bilobum]|uniref:probable protein phosphatase 2C 65 n=1 Tax=Gastrolobium bilobum TaxID=150636 RepID=UPI002AB171FD|nr:probable protein phosphatase 2C 65 [Gastrolobium bilobum]